MKIELECSCGAKAVFDDPRGHYIVDGGKSDERGHKFRVELLAYEWQERHKDCQKKEATNG